MWGLLEHMLEVPTVGKDVHCSHTRGGQTVSRHRKGCRGPHAFPTREMEASGFNGNRCVLGPSLLVLLSAWVKKPLYVVGSSQCRDS